jgi:hypothetical protein
MSIKADPFNACLGGGRWCARPCQIHNKNFFLEFMLLLFGKFCCGIFDKNYCQSGSRPGAIGMLPLSEGMSVGSAGATGRKSQRRLGR